MQVGRVSAYGGLGVAFGTVGASLYAGFDLSGVHMAVQWIAALVVIWLGLSNIGLVPSMAGIDRALAPVAGQVSRLRSAVASGGPEASLLAGMVWGLTPCAMVYGAIFNSLLTGDAISGGLMMLAFGIGTVPAVVVSSLLLYRASRSRLRIGRELSGALMIGAGVLGLLLTVPGSPFCISR
jgi:sulfite exporter TauE/SafE